MITPNQEIRALWWRQPYANLMLLGKIETRTWPTKYRGWVLICASKSHYPDSIVRKISGLKQSNRIWEIWSRCRFKYFNGHAIAIGKLVDCRPMITQDEEATFVKYRYPWNKIVNLKSGKSRLVRKQLWCHVYEEIQAIKPFEIKGKQGWCKLTEDIIRNIEIKNTNPGTGN